MSSSIDVMMAIESDLPNWGHIGDNIVEKHFVKWEEERKIEFQNDWIKFEAIIDAKCPEDPAFKQMWRDGFERYHQRRRGINILLRHSPDFKNTLKNNYVKAGLVSLEDNRSGNVTTPPESPNSHAKSVTEEREDDGQGLTWKEKKLKVIEYWTNLWPEAETKIEEWIANKKADQEEIEFMRKFIAAYSDKSPGSAFESIIVSKARKRLTAPFTGVVDELKKSIHATDALIYDARAVVVPLEKAKLLDLPIDHRHPRNVMNLLDSHYGSDKTEDLSKSSVAKLFNLGITEIAERRTEQTREVRRLIQGERRDLLKRWSNISSTFTEEEGVPLGSAKQRRRSISELFAPSIHSDHNPIHLSGPQRHFDAVKNPFEQRADAEKRAKLLEDTIRQSVPFPTLTDSPLTIGQDEVPNTDNQAPGGYHDETNTQETPLRPLPRGQIPTIFTPSTAPGMLESNSIITAMTVPMTNAHHAHSMTPRPSPLKTIFEGSIHSSASILPTTTEEQGGHQINTTVDDANGQGEDEKTKGFAWRLLRQRKESSALFGNSDMTDFFTQRPIRPSPPPGPNPPGEDEHNESNGVMVTHQENKTQNINQNNTSSQPPHVPFLSSTMMEDPSAIEDLLPTPVLARPDPPKRILKLAKHPKDEPSPQKTVEPMLETASPVTLLSSSNFIPAILSDSPQPPLNAATSPPVLGGNLPSHSYPFPLTSQSLHPPFASQYQEVQDVQLSPSQGTQEAPAPFDDDDEPTTELVFTRFSQHPPEDEQGRIMATTEANNASLDSNLIMRLPPDSDTFSHSTSNALLTENSVPTELTMSTPGMSTLLVNGLEPARNIVILSSSDDSMKPSGSNPTSRDNSPPSGSAPRDYADKTPVPVPIEFKRPEPRTRRFLTFHKRNSLSPIVTSPQSPDPTSEDDQDKPESNDFE